MIYAGTETGEREDISIEEDGGREIDSQMKF